MSGVNDVLDENVQSSPPKFRRVLGLWDLILYGIILIMPIAPIPLFGLVQRLSDNQSVTAILLAMVAMVLTALSYGRMATVYPSAGSAYVYVGRGLNVYLGFLAGWAMFLDYLLVPLVCTVYGALTLHRIEPRLSYIVWSTVLVAVMTAINLRGIQATSGANLVLFVVMMVVVLSFIIIATRFLLRTQSLPGLFSWQPFYRPESFHLRSISAATSLAALTYGGFDGVSTLSEDARNPRRDILRATVLVCIFTGIFGGLQIYLAQRVWPDYRTFPNLETAFMDVAQKVGGKTLFEAFAVILIIANLGAGMAAQAGLSRLLFGMGRDGVIPRGVFTHLSPKRATPTYSLLLIAAFTLVGSLLLNYEQVADLINFGAFLAYMGVNAAAIRQFYLQPRPGHSPRLWSDCMLPLLGLLFCAAIWLGLPAHAKLVGSIWFVCGLFYLAAKTRGFRTGPPIYEI